jgi:hypothetical protein
MQVTLLGDGHLSCQYAFSGDFMGFTGTTSSTGTVAPERIRYLERVFTDAEYIALPPEMPNGMPDPIRSTYQLSTTFGGSTKRVRLVPGTITTEAENDVLMQSVDAVFNVCPTRPLTPIED